ncbi:MAG: hypothetical protein IMZ62_12875 [Chloroflexi bacterium]|nr:hypothetical protein [Chloroflexota bacterium]MBE3119097.1 hypothetical protein [Candidatus Atribacteria bacterium]
MSNYAFTKRDGRIEAVLDGLALTPQEARIRADMIMEDRARVAYQVAEHARRMLRPVAGRLDPEWIARHTVAEQAATQAAQILFRLIGLRNWTPKHLLVLGKALGLMAQLNQTHPLRQRDAFDADTLAVIPMLIQAGQQPPAAAAVPA